MVLNGRERRRVAENCWIGTSSFGSAGSSVPQPFQSTSDAFYPSSCAMGSQLSATVGLVHLASSRLAATEGNSCRAPEASKFSKCCNIERNSKMPDTHVITTVKIALGA